MPIVSSHSAASRRLRGGVHTGAFIVALVTSIASTAVGQTYYVDNQCPTCSNSGAGTEAQPYCNITAAVAAHRGPDVTIVVKPGVYREQVTVPASGAPGRPFTIRALGPGARIEGADVFSSPAQWVQESDVVRTGGQPVPYMGTAWLATGVGWEARQVFVNGARLTPSTAAPDQLPVNAFTWVGGQGLYVNLGGDNPGTQEVLVSHRDYGFNLFSKSWVTIEGFEVIHTDDRAINLQTGCADLVIARNRVALANGSGIQSVNGTRLVIEGNVVSNCNYHGIALINNANNCVVRNNESFGNADPAIRRANGIYLFAAPSNTLSGNRLHDNQDTGIQFNGGSNNCVAFNNISWNNGDHGYDHLDAIGTIHVNSVAYGNHKDGFSFEGNSPNSQLYNCIATENGLTTREFNLWVNAVSSVGFVSDHNIFWNSTSQEPIKFGATVYATLASYQGASGADIHSLQADPLFTDPAAGCFVPIPGSPAIDAANSAVPFWPTIDASGNVRLDDTVQPDRGEGPVTYADIGALECVTRGELPPVQMPPRRPPDSEQIPRLFSSTTTGGSQDAEAASIALSTGFPNPSRGAVDFALDLPHGTRVSWAVFDLQGRVIWSEDGVFGAGRSILRWDGWTSRGEPAATGVYLVRARVGGTQLTQRVVRF